ncbi:MAG: HK97 gp10 family phage protein [Bacteroidetes bacterium]|nr:HK97 gp10 family phage protein [Bacteroidota bacterium]
MEFEFKIDQKQIDQLSKKLFKVVADIDEKKIRNEILNKPAALVRDVAKSNIFNNHKPVKRYSKGMSKKGKGKGKVVATYYPGNLKRSIKVLRFRMATRTLTIGPKYTRNSHGDFNNSKRVDGWYAHLVEFGAGGRTGRSFGFMRRAWLSTKTRVEKMIINNLKNKVQELWTKH